MERFHIVLVFNNIDLIYYSCLFRPMKWPIWSFALYNSQTTQLSNGQLFSKFIFGVFKRTKKHTRNFVTISALASKKRSNKKKQWNDFEMIKKKKMSLLFWVKLFLETWVKILAKISLFFFYWFEDTKRTFQN